MKHFVMLGIICLFLYLLFIAGFYLLDVIKPQEIISPCAESGCEVEKVATSSAEPKITEILPEVEVTRDVLKGLASYYSRNGCLGCSENMIMANGDPLDDDKLTVAFNRAPLNSFIKITNVKTGAEVTAKVTDRGGFERHGKIVDLSVATKNALGCGDVCKVEVEI